MRAVNRLMKKIKPEVLSADGNSVYMARSAPASTIPVQVVLDWTASLRH